MKKKAPGQDGITVEIPSKVSPNIVDSLVLIWRWNRYTLVTIS